MRQRKADKQSLALVWDNFGPLHDDRLRACVERFTGRSGIIGVEINGASETYSWENRHDGELPKTTIFPDSALNEISEAALFRALARRLLQLKARHVFLCHYERFGILLTAWLLRLFGRRVYVMGCPKFDDRPRGAAKEFLKQLFLSPYHGALAGGPGTRSYFEFLGLRGKPVALGYNSVSNARIRDLAGHADISFYERDFVIVARLIPKKNIATAIRAYARFAARHPLSTRRLHICGDGPLEAELRSLAESLGVGNRVLFHGFLQSDGVAPVLVRALALVLVSVEEQFGNVVPEALSLGIPLILSDACGARYELLRSGVNGFVVEPDNEAGLAYFMGVLHGDEGLWTRFSTEATRLAWLGDVERFADGVEALTR